MATILIFLIVISCTASTWAQSSSCSSSCSSFIVDNKNFDTSAFLWGSWFEQYRFYEEQAVDTTCNTAKYFIQPTHLIYLVMEGYRGTEMISKTSTLWAANPYEPGKFKLSFNRKSTPVDYYVLSTDHNSYAIVASFKDLGNTCREHAWIFTREPQPSDSLLSSAMNIAKTHGVKTEKFLRSSQANCHS